jgi:hypothetical protein
MTNDAEKSIMFTSDSTPATSHGASSPADSSIGNYLGVGAVGRAQRTDTECRARARQFLIDLIGAPPDNLCWDHTHCLQGHARLGARELVVIAPRDEAHCTVVLTTHDWEQVRRSGGDQRRSLLGACAIADRSRLTEVLAADELAPAA